MILILNTYIIDVHQMFGTSIQTWKDLLFSNERDKSVILSSVTQGQNTTKTSSFSLPAWDPERLPPSAHLVENLPSRMQEHLGDIIDQHFSDKAARTNFTDRSDYSVTPDVVLGLLRSQCASFTFDLSNEAGTRTIANFLSYPVKVIYELLTGNFLDVQGQEHTSNSSVITDRIFLFDGGIKILWGEISSRAFDRLIGEFMGELRDGSSAELCAEPVPTSYRGYKAILAQVRLCPCHVPYLSASEHVLLQLWYHASDIQPRVHWAIVFSGLQYIIIYIPRGPRRPTVYCSPVTQFCLRPDDEQEPAIGPPIWSILI